jgi:hypothetical protein
MFYDNEDFEGYFVYQYQHLDDLRAVLKPAEVFGDTGQFYDGDERSVEERVEEVKQLFLKKGWEGDGEIGLIWLPPFVDIGIEDTHGTYIWHVKQGNNGMSWLASPVELDFKRLMDQN